MWKKINREEIHNYSVGDKVRIDGVEDVITYLYGGSDKGFRTKSSEWDKDICPCNVFSTLLWDQYQVEVWEEQSEQGDESMNNFELKKGMYFKLEDMTEGDFNALVKLCKSQGISPWGDVTGGLSDCKEYSGYLFIDNDGDLITNCDFNGSLEDCLEYLHHKGITSKLVDINELLGKSEPVNETEKGEGSHKELLETIKVVGNAVQRICGTKRSEGDDVLVALINKAAEKFL